MSVKPALVIDNGSGVLKAGFAGEEQPKYVIPAIVGRPKHTKAMVGGTIEPDAILVGAKAEEYRGLLKLSYPIEHGIVTNWDDMEKIWKDMFSELKIQSEEQPVLITEPALNSRRNKDRTAKVLFETFNVPAVYFAVQAVLSLYSSGKTTGVVLDSGDGVTHSVPVYQGFTMPNAIRRSDVAGRDVTHYLQLLLRKSGHLFKTSAEKEIVRLIKESTCAVSLNAKDLEKVDKVNYTLPDGSVIQLGAERFVAPEILFNPELIGEEQAGVHELVVESITKVDIDLRKDLYSTIVLSGGSTLFKGYGERFLKEVQKLAPKETKIKIYAPPERKNSTWIGGSIFAGLSSFKKVYITAKEYDEDPDIIHKKTF